MPSVLVAGAQPKEGGRACVDLCLTDKELEFREDTRKRDRTQASKGALNSLSGIGGWNHSLILSASDLSRAAKHLDVVCQ